MLTGLLVAGCSFSTYGLPGGENDPLTTTEASTSAPSSSSAPDPSTGPGPTSSTSTGSAPSCGDGEVDTPEECDDNNLKDDDGCSSTCIREYRRVFATSQVFTGDLGGLAGADAKCQEAAASLDPPGLFRAWISTDAESPATRFVRSEVPYVDLDLMPIATDWDDLTDGMIEGGIYKTETGVLPPESICQPGFRVAWTSTDPFGSKPIPGTDCTGWTATNDKGAIGQLSFKSQDWTEALANLNCTCLASLYCFEQ